MKTYSSEAAFSHAFCNLLDKKGWFVQRIESGTTGRGIPDVYAVSPDGKVHWFELKNVKHKYSGEETIPWRPGQQGWLMRQHRLGIAVRTICAFTNGIWVIRHDKLHKHSVVASFEVDIANSIGELL